MLVAASRRAPSHSCRNTITACTAAIPQLFAHGRRCNSVAQREAHSTRHIDSCDWCTKNRNQVQQQYAQRANSAGYRSLQSALPHGVASAVQPQWPGHRGRHLLARSRRSTASSTVEIQFKPWVSSIPQPSISISPDSIPQPDAPAGPGPTGAVRRLRVGCRPPTSTAGTFMPRQQRNVHVALAAHSLLPARHHHTHRHAVTGSRGAAAGAGVARVCAAATRGRHARRVWLIGWPTRGAGAAARERASAGTLAAAR